MLVGLQSFAERMPGRRLLVCDFGFNGAQAEFLRGLGMLLERPPTLESRGRLSLQGRAARLPSA